jgi:hypothetical protein
MAVEIEIPVKLYIKRYLNVKYGDPAHMNRKDLEGSFLYELIEDPRQDRDKEAGNYTHKLNLFLPDHVLMRKGYYLTPTQVTTFNCFMERFIKIEMRNHIDLILRTNPATEIRDAIYDYQQHYKLHDDYFPFDSIKKDYYRYRIRSNGQIRVGKSAM